MKVNILLSTYNGEAYLSEQIESIRRQTYQDWKLLIRDDGSSDGTVDLIQSYTAKDKRIVFINPDDCHNLGVITSFFTLLKHDKADYYFFSDQDDVWLENKLALTLAESEGRLRDKPLLVYTDLKVVDKELNVMHESMVRVQSHHANTTLRQELTENTVTGGTVMINHALAELWQKSDGLLMHDWYLALLASAMGDLVYVDCPTQLYRQHDHNVLGARTLSKRVKNWFNPHRLVAKYWWLIGSSQEQARCLLDLDLSQDKRDMVEAFVTVMDKSFFDRIKTLRQFGFAKNRAFHTLVFTTLIVTKFGYRRH